MSAVSTLDDQTASAIRQALSAAAAGRLADACSIGEQALEAGGEPAALHAMLGALRTRRGDLEGAIRHLAKAHELRPQDILIAKNLATALAQIGRHREALDVLPEALAKQDPSLHLLRLRGFLAQSLADFESAVKAYERVVSSAPNDWESWNNLGNARRALDDHLGSLEASTRAVELNPSSGPVRLNYATSLEYAGKVEEAEQELRRMSSFRRGYVTSCR